MLEIESLRPYSTKVINKKGKVIFDYKYLVIRKDGKSYNFIPIESKEIIFNLNTLEIENINDIFVFQRQNKFLRISLYELLSNSDIRKYLKPVFESIILEYDFDSIYNFDSDSEIVSVAYNEDIEDIEDIKDTEGIEFYDEDVLSILVEIKKLYIDNEIDRALLEGNKEMFVELINLLNDLNKMDRGSFI